MIDPPSGGVYDQVIDDPGLTIGGPAATGPGTGALRPLLLVHVAHAALLTHLAHR